MKTWIGIGALLVVSAGLYLLPKIGSSRSSVMEHRFVYISRGLGNDADVEAIRDVVERAAKHRYTGVVFSSMFDRVTLQPPEYFRRLGEVKSACDAWGLDIIPSLFTAGYGGGVLSHNKNLAAAVPVRDALYIVRDGAARPFQPRRARVVNGGFEEARGQKLDAYALQDAPGSVSHVDNEVYNQGRSSLRLEGFDRAAHGNARVMQEVDVEPFRSYRVSCWMRSSDLTPAGNVQVQIRTLQGRILMSWQPDLASNEEWREVVTGFNSLEYDRVRIYVGIWEGRHGSLWIDDLRIEEVGPVNVLRRPGTPVTITSDASGMRFEEGRDYYPLEDANLDFRFDHRGPPIRITPDGLIADGDKLRVSYFQGMAINRHQVSVCMAEPEVYRIWRESLEMLNDTLHPAGYLIAMDEVRAGGWCEACLADGLTAAERLGRCITRQVEMIRDIDSDANVFIWSDMLDPNHNARSDYYTYNGDFDGSWRHVPKDLIIACWYFDRRKDSLRHFDRLGFRTIAGAYYDAENLDRVNGWLDALGGAKGACGIMYTTWMNNYELLEPFGDLVATGGRSSTRGEK